MKYRNLGRSGLKVSEISLGSWLSCNDSQNIEGPAGIIDKAYELGINFFDTANEYSRGNAEEILGRVLAKYPRESYVLATKVYWPTGEGPNDRGLSRKHISEQVEKSLKRLGTEYIDLYYCHWFDAETPLEETLRAMDDLVARGLVLYTGVSNWTAAQISEGLRIAGHYRLHRMIANQPSYNMFDRFIEKETVPLCRMGGIGQVVYSPLAQGVLAGKYRLGMEYPKGSRAANHDAKAEVTVWDYLNDSILACVEKLLPLAKELGITLSQLALAWVLRLSDVSSALTGASRPEQVMENVKASGLIIPDEILLDIERILSENLHNVRHNVVPWQTTDI